jgi:hypothetical protein
VLCALKTATGNIHVDGLSAPNPRCIVLVLANLDRHDCRGSDLRGVRRRLDSEPDRSVGVDQFPSDRGADRIARSCDGTDVARLFPCRLHRYDFGVGELRLPRELNFYLYTLRGNDIGPPIMPTVGRFFPLGFQEFNLIRHFTDTITGYHAVRIAQLLIFSWVLLILNEDLSIKARAALVILALITPSILTSFSWLIYHEANVLLCIVCLVLFVERFEQTHSLARAVAAAVCAQIMIYYKETASLLLVGFAVSRLVLRCRNTDGRSWDYSRLWDRESRLDLCLALLSVLFWLYYLGVMLPHPNMQYAEDLRQPLAELFLAYIKTVSSLHKSRSARIVVCGRGTVQDLSDRAMQSSPVAIMGWASFWWRSLLRCLPGSWYLGRR